MLLVHDGKDKPCLLAVFCSGGSVGVAWSASTTRTLVYKTRVHGWFSETFHQCVTVTGLELCAKVTRLYSGALS